MLIDNDFIENYTVQVCSFIIIRAVVIKTTYYTDRKSQLNYLIAAVHELMGQCYFS